jgi:hypothetical protein
LPYDSNGGAADIEFVEYVLWCYRCPTATDCADGVAEPRGARP